MTPKEFCCWLDGFLSSRKELSREDLERIHIKLLRALSDEIPVISGDLKTAINFLKHPGGPT